MVSSRVESLIRLQINALSELLYAIDECNDSVHTAMITTTIDRINEIVNSTVHNIMERKGKDGIKSKYSRGLRSPVRTSNRHGTALPPKIMKVPSHSSKSHKWRYACQDPETRVLVERTLLKVSAIWKYKKYLHMMKYLQQWKHNTKSVITSSAHTAQAPIENIYSRLYGNHDDVDPSLQEYEDDIPCDKKPPNVLNVNEFLQSKAKITSPPTSNASSPRYYSHQPYEDFRIKPIDALHKQQRHRVVVEHEDPPQDDMSVISDIWTADPESYYAHDGKIERRKDMAIVVETQAKKLPHRLRPPPPPIT